jgi:hypothetical protein
MEEDLTQDELLNLLKNLSSEEEIKQSAIEIEWQNAQKYERNWWVYYTGNHPYEIHKNNIEARFMMVDHGLPGKSVLDIGCGPLQAKTRRPSFVHQVQLFYSANLGQQFEQLTHIVNDFAYQSPRTASGLGNSNRNAVFVDIQAHVEFANLLHGRSPLVADDESHSM